MQLNQELGQEPDMKITVYHNVKGNVLFGGDSSHKEPIGELYVPLPSMTNRCDQPQFFNIINQEGMFVGQVLANFYLKVVPKLPKNKNQIGSAEDNQMKELDKILQDFKSSIEPKFRVNLKFALYGIRDLIHKSKKPVVTVKLTNSENPDDIKQITQESLEQLDPNNKKDPFSPNFGVVETFKKVELAKEPLSWPFLEITVHDAAKKGALLGALAGGCETSHTTVSLIEYAENIIDEYQLLYSRFQLQRNQDNLSYVQPQVEPKKFLKQMGIDLELNMKNQVDVDLGDSPTPDLTNARETYRQKSARQTERPTVANNLFKIDFARLDDEDDLLDQSTVVAR